MRILLCKKKLGHLDSLLMKYDKLTHSVYN